jgi:hypothetical protein
MMRTPKQEFLSAASQTFTRESYLFAVLLFLCMINVELTSTIIIAVAVVWLGGTLILRFLEYKYMISN